MNADDARKRLAEALSLLAALQGAAAADAGFNGALDRARQEALETARAYERAQKEQP